MSSANVIELRPVRTATDWAEEIRTALGQSAAGIVRAAQLLAESKAEIGEKSWWAMVSKQLPITLRTANKFISIAANPRLCAESNWTRLPSSWTSLYELSRWSDTELAVGLRHETFITPELKGAEIQKLRNVVRRKIAAGDVTDSMLRTRRTPARTPAYTVTWRREHRTLLQRLDALPHQQQRAVAQAQSKLAEEMLEGFGA